MTEPSGELLLDHGHHRDVRVELDVQVGDVEIVVESKGDHHCGGRVEDVVVHVVEGGNVIVIDADIKSERATLKWKAKQVEPEPETAPETNPARAQIARHLAKGKA